MHTPDQPQQGTGNTWSRPVTVTIMDADPDDTTQDRRRARRRAYWVAGFVMSLIVGLGLIVP